MMGQNLKDDYFVMATECHLYPSIDHLIHHPQLKSLVDLLDRAHNIYKKPIIASKTAEVINTEWNVDALIQDMNTAGIDIGFGLREGFLCLTHGEAPLSTNGWVWEQIQKYPDRLMLEVNPGPILKRGVKDAIWDMEYWVREKGAKLVKVFAPEDGPLNDPRMWPFYEKAQELGVVLTMHMGASLIQGMYVKYVTPILLDDVLNDFPNLKVIAYHMAWPYEEELMMLCVKYPNLYAGLSLRIGWYTRSPYRGYHHIGEMVQLCGGADKLIFGLDWPAVDAKASVDYIKNFDMPEELVKNWGYPKLTELDKRKILGLNLAKLIGIEPKKRI